MEIPWTHMQLNVPVLAQVITYILYVFVSVLNNL